MDYPEHLLAKVDADLEHLAERYGLSLDGVNLDNPQQRRAVVKQLYVRRYKPHVTSLRESTLPAPAGEPDLPAGFALGQRRRRPTSNPRPMRRGR